MNLRISLDDADDDARAAQPLAVADPEAVAFARRLRQRLDASVHELDPSITARLHGARQRALERQTLPVSGLSLAGLGRRLANTILPRGRIALAMATVIALALGSSYFGQLQQAAEIEEVDSALLADDLPIDAYLDRGFDAWVHSKDSD